ncbi:uncharacterized protein PFLUO_LOCUS3896 [Penicillium psychrofluorescens]|uniref:uncharacterized protein n=1 Tax=Penicillium psychrofluorescens TaxID=3158075 RepID=UPI003CCE073B
MLTFISKKFSQQLTEPLHEPRAALFVNRFTRTATIMHATSGVTEILGLTPQQLITKSFYFCIQERCLRDAVRCIESAKANDSIAYLRFWFRNPLQDENEFYPSEDPYTVTPPPLELESVVSCTSDGLVVILRRARPPIPTASYRSEPVPVYANGLFAAPWALEPVFSYGGPSYSTTEENAWMGQSDRTLCQDDSPHGVSSSAITVVNEAEETNPHSELLYDTIRDAAVFAWGIVGINRSLEQYKRGTPTGDARPVDGEKVNDT